MNGMSEIHLGKHTRREFRERMRSGQLRAVIIPVAAIEQHLEHLAMEHDWRSVTHVANEVAQRLSPHVVVAEGLMAGISEHHMNHPGTLSLTPATFMAVVHDLVDSMVRAGFTNILVLNGHGGNVAPMRAVWDQFVRRYQVNLHFMPYWDVYTVQDAEELLESGTRLPQDLPGHAQEFETSFALAAFPENVRTDIWTDQVDQKPAMATAEKGKAFIDRTIDRVSAYVQDMIEGRSVVKIPPFM
ncbi:MAG TPA: creatininase family protein, partial [Pirellulaceae bacterium]|nr:creatininase family protein [Pirellulaceae bacterium]